MHEYRFTSTVLHVLIKVGPVRMKLYCQVGIGVLQLVVESAFCCCGQRCSFTGVESCATLLSSISDMY